MNLLLQDIANEQLPALLSSVLTAVLREYERRSKLAEDLLEVVQQSRGRDRDDAAELQRHRECAASAHHCSFSFALRTACHGATLSPIGVTECPVDQARPVFASLFCMSCDRFASPEALAASEFASSTREC